MAIIDWLDIQFTEALAQALIHSLWQGILIISVLVVGDQLGLVRTAKLKYVFYMSGLILLFISTIAGFFIAMYWPQPVQPNSFLTPFNTLIQKNPGSETVSTAKFFWQGALVLCWLGGFLYYCSKNVIGSMRLFQLRRNAHNAPKHWQRRVNEISRSMRLSTRTILLSTSEVSVPFVMGVIRPVIMFPANYFIQLTPQEVEAILKHELVHIGRDDYLLNIIQVVIESLLFFNPATWWLSKQIRRQREYCCDDRVQTNMINRTTYLEALYNAARISTNQPTPGIALFDKNSELIMRMKRMSSAYQPKRNLRALVMASIGLLTVFGLFAFNTIEKRNSPTKFNSTYSEVAALLKRDVNFEANINGAIQHGLLNHKLNKIDIIERRRNTREEENQFAGVQTIAKIAAKVAPAIAQELNALSNRDILTNHIGLAASLSVSGLASTVVQNVTSSLRHGIIADTNPPSPRMLELQAEIEEVSEEMEELAEEMEELIENTVEAEMEKIEAIAEEIELLAEQYESRIENSEEVERLEELAELLEEEMEAFEEQFEDLEESLIEELEEKLEAKAEQYEDYESMSEEQRAKLAAEMKELSAELQAITAEIQNQYSSIIENSEIKKLQKELDEVSKQLSLTYENMSPVTEEMQRLQAEIQVQQQIMQENMNGVLQTLQKEMQLRAQEIEILHQELLEETHRWKSKN